VKNNSVKTRLNAKQPTKPTQNPHPKIHRTTTNCSRTKNQRRQIKSKGNQTPKKREKFQQNPEKS
jgi:hypothetical protein